MIKSITSGNGIQVDNNYSSLPYINQNPNNPMQGMIRVNGNDLQVFDGSAWIHVGMSFPTVSLTGPAYSAIHWAQQKMAEEENIKRLAEKHPAVEDAMNTINEAYDKLKVIVALVEEETKRD
jgi:hypothetical protein